MASSTTPNPTIPPMGTDNQATANAQVSRRRALLLATAAATMIAITFQAFGQLGQSSIWWGTVAMRVASITVGVFAVNKFTLKTHRNIPWRTVALAGAFFSLGDLLFIVATRSGAVAVVSVLSGLEPGFIALFAWLFLREHLSRYQQLGLVLALLGIALVAGS